LAHQVFGHKENKDTPHPIETESLSGFIGKDIRYAGGHLLRWNRAGLIFDFSHPCLLLFFRVFLKLRVSEALHNTLTHLYCRVKYPLLQGYRI